LKSAVRQYRASQVGTIEGGVAQVNIHEYGITKIGSPKVGIGSGRPAQVSSAQVRVVKVCVTKIAEIQLRLFKVRSNQPGGHERPAREVETSQLPLRQVNSVEANRRGQLRIERILFRSSFVRSSQQSLDRDKGAADHGAAYECKRNFAPQSAIRCDGGDGDASCDDHHYNCETS
jgi:hypothetical protein